MKLKVSKKPIPVIAMEYTGKNYDEVKKFCKDCVYKSTEDNKTIYIKTLEGNMKCKIGNYIIKGIDGEFYPIQRDIFEKTYNILEYWG